MRAAALLAVLILCSCKGVGLGSFDTFDPDKPESIGPGISSLDTESEEQKKDQKWFDKFYGSKQGWGWETTQEKDENCSFWGNCKDGAAKSDDAAPADNCSFYGTCETTDDAAKSDTTEPAKDCGFYGNCKKEESTGWW